MNVKKKNISLHRKFISITKIFKAMQKIIFSILAIGLSIGAFAQEQMLRTSSQQANLFTEISASKEIGVYMPSIFDGGGCADLNGQDLYIRSVGQQGSTDTYPMFGPNPFLTGGGQGYSFSSPQKIVGVMIYFGGYAAGTDFNGTVKVADAAGTSVLASVAYNTAELQVEQTSAGLASSFSTPAIAQSFMLQIEYPANAAGLVTMNVITTKEDCHHNTAYAKYQGQWLDLATLFEDPDERENLLIFPIIDDSFVGLTASDLNNLTYVYPNPASEQVMIAASVKMSKVEIYNIVGQKIYSEDVNGISTSVSTAGFATGQYIVKMYTQSGVAVKKMIVK